MGAKEKEKGHGEEKETKKRRRKKEKLINSADSERKALLHFLFSLSEGKGKAQKQSYSFGDLILGAENKFNTLPGSAILLGTQSSQFYPLWAFSQSVILLSFQPNGQRYYYKQELDCIKPVNVIC